jgi:hypothetical protein
MKYYAWAKSRRILLICGHTHQAIFGSLTHYDRLQIRLENHKLQLDQAPEEKKPMIREKIEDIQQEIYEILDRRSGVPPKSLGQTKEYPIPCYFNDGCCGYANGITCLEIEKGRIRLIKWQHQTQSRIVRAEADIPLLLQYIKQDRPTDADLDPE